MNTVVEDKASEGADQPTTSQLLFSFEGRAPRLFYWAAQIGSIAVFAAATLAFRSLGDWIKAEGESGDVTPATLVLVFGALALSFALLAMTFWIGFAVVVRRWHDRGKSWAWALLGFVPLVGWLWQGIECGYLEGTLGPNQFGPSPKGILSVNYDKSSPYVSGVRM